MSRANIDINNIKQLAFTSEIDKFQTEVDNLITQSSYEKNAVLLQLLSLLDVTTLNDEDYSQSIKNISSITTSRVGEKDINVAGVCVYSNLLPILNQQQIHNEVKRVVVSGGFPTAQISLKAKLSDISFCLENNADEIDIPINRGLFFENKEELKEELIQISNLIHNNSDSKLKIILETSELKTYQNIYDASILAMECGADFIKTSTGKVSRGADVYSSVIMLVAIKDYFIKTNKLVGFKAAGGIRSYQDAVKYYIIAKQIMGEAYINPSTFRIGCSNLRNDIINNIK